MRPEPKIVLYQDGVRITTIDFGTVPEGTERILKIRISNEGNVTIENLEYKLNSDEVVIMDKPEKLSPGETGDIVLRYMPTRDSEGGLNIQLGVVGVYII